MTGSGREQRPTGARGRALSVDLLADLHAGALDEHQAAALQRSVADDPWAGAVLRALDDTVDDLAALPAQQLPMPPSVAHRIDAALAAQGALPASALPNSSPNSSAVPAGVAPVRRRRHRRVAAAWAGAAVLVAAAAVAGVLALTGVQRHVAGTPRAGGAPGAATQVDLPLTISGNDLDSVLPQALARHDLGPLSQPGRLRACLTANGVPAGVTPLGATQVAFERHRAVLLVLPTARIARFRLLVVGEDCSTATPSHLADHLIGPR